MWLYSIGLSLHAIRNSIFCYASGRPIQYDSKADKLFPCLPRFLGIDFYFGYSEREWRGLDSSCSQPPAAHLRHRLRVHNRTVVQTHPPCSRWRWTRRFACNPVDLEHRSSSSENVVHFCIDRLRVKLSCRYRPTVGPISSHCNFNWIFI